MLAQSHSIIDQISFQFIECSQRLCYTDQTRLNYLKFYDTSNQIFSCLFVVRSLAFYHICETLSHRSRLCTTMMPRQTMKMRKIYALDSYAWVDSRRYTQSQGGTTTPSSESKSQEIRKKQQQTYLQSEFY